MITPEGGGSSSEAQPSDILTYLWVGRTLRTGMYLSFASMSVGLLWWLAAGMPGGEQSVSTQIPLQKLLPELLAGDPLALLNVGVLLLLATPAVTLLTAILTYVVQRNWRFVAVGAIVAAILILSLALSMK